MNFSTSILWTALLVLLKLQAEGFGLILVFRNPVLVHNKAQCTEDNKKKFLFVPRRVKFDRISLIGNSYENLLDNSNFHINEQIIYNVYSISANDYTWNCIS